MRATIFLVCLIFALSAEAAPSKKTLVIHVGCGGEGEAADDLGYSVDKNKKELAALGVEIKVDEKAGTCGYTLKDGRRSKHLRGAMTDVDLHLEIDTFYGKSKK